MCHVNFHLIRIIYFDELKEKLSFAVAITDPKWAITF